MKCFYFFGIYIIKVTANMVNMPYGSLGKAVIFVVLSGELRYLWFSRESCAVCGSLGKGVLFMVLLGKL